MKLFQLFDLFHIELMIKTNFKLFKCDKEAKK